MQVECLSVKSGRYEDTVRTYLVKPTVMEGMSEEEIESAVRERFQVGPNWHENKLELCRPNHDGSAFTVKIREPYLD